jgi:hypothetical protein
LLTLSEVACLKKDSDVHPKAFCPFLWTIRTQPSEAFLPGKAAQTSQFATDIERKNGH